MKRLLFIALLFVAIIPAHAQNIYIDVQHNWYMQPARLELDQLDTLVLLMEKPDDDPAKPMLLWQYAGNDKFQPITLYNPTPGMQFTYSMQKWKIEQITPTTYKLNMKEGDKMFSGKVRKYNMITERDDHYILRKIILVRKP